MAEDEQTAVPDLTQQDGIGTEAQDLDDVHEEKEQEDNEDTIPRVGDTSGIIDEEAEEEDKDSDPQIEAYKTLVSSSTPTTELEIALDALFKRKEKQVARLSAEIMKMKKFVIKRRQTYKRKRKDDGAPIRPVSAYNLFIRDRFARLAKANEQALKSEDENKTMRRVPPSSLVRSTGIEWKELPAETKAKYEEKAKADRKRYEEEMARYQPPDKQSNRKRNKTGYNMFFSAHVLRMKQTDGGVPSERGSVARLVGNAWKQLSSEEKQFYEREADKHNGSNPVREGEEDDEEEDAKRQQMADHYHMQAAGHPADMHMHPAMMPMPHPQHDPRHHGYYPPHMYAQPYAHYDYSQHHRHQQARAQGYNQGYPPRHSYEGGGQM